MLTEEPGLGVTTAQGWGTLQGLPPWLRQDRLSDWTPSRGCPHWLKAAGGWMGARAEASFRRRGPRAAGASQSFILEC